MIVPGRRRQVPDRRGTGPEGARATGPRQVPPEDPRPGGTLEGAEIFTAGHASLLAVMLARIDQVSVEVADLIRYTPVWGPAAHPARVHRAVQDRSPEGSPGRQCRPCVSDPGSTATCATASTIRCAATTIGCKQEPGWVLEQPSPGTLAWTIPSGRRYTTVATWRMMSSGRPGSVGGPLDSPLSAMGVTLPGQHDNGLPGRARPGRGCCRQHCAVTETLTQTTLQRVNFDA